ncbi:MAG: ABC transporter substrate-binding protein [Candidatus Giovannonibacteria bacterium]|nr:MAG: ABC transporter substrate-binding protein [Candidatus Giovannonibacteria bacterium]
MFTKIIILAIVVAAAFAGWYWWDLNNVETVKISFADAENLKFLLAVLQDKGIAEKHGLKLDVLFSPPSEAERRLIEKVDGVEVGTINPLSIAITNQAKNIKLRAFVSTYQTNQALVVKAASPYYKFEDLKGARVAMHPKGSASYTMHAVGMKTLGLDLERDFKLVFGSFPQNEQRLANGEVEAAFLNAVATARFLATGNYREVVNLSREWGGITSSAVIPFVDLAAHADWISQNPNKVKRLREAVLEAAIFIRKNTQLIEEYKGILGLERPEEINLMKERLPAIYPLAWLPEEHNALVKKAFELNLIPEPPKENIFVE